MKIVRDDNTTEEVTMNRCQKEEGKWEDRDYRAQGRVMLGQ